MTAISHGALVDWGLWHAGHQAPATLLSGLLLGTRVSGCSGGSGDPSRSLQRDRWERLLNYSVSMAWR